MSETKPARRRGILHWTGLVLSGALLLTVLSIAVLVVAVPAVARATPYTILTGSMSPGYAPGTLVITRHVDPDDIRIGDIVTYQLKSGEQSVVTHRVIRIQTGLAADDEAEFITKGDANDEADAAPVRAVQVRGRLWYAVPYVGYLNNVVNGDMRPAIIPVVAGLLFLYAAWTFASGARDKILARRREEEARPVPERLTAFPDDEHERLAASGSRS